MGVHGLHEEMSWEGEADGFLRVRERVRYLGREKDEIFEFLGWGERELHGEREE